MTESTHNPCKEPLHPDAEAGFRLFNAGDYFDAHEALETAWRAETGKIRDLYQGILQIAVTYLHITRGNYNGAVKVYERSQKWLKDWPDHCKGIYLDEFKKNAEIAIKEVERLGPAHIAQFDKSLFKPIRWDTLNHTYICDKCGAEMYEKNCKVTCPNCGNRFDCSDLNIYFD